MTETNADTVNMSYGVEEENAGRIHGRVAGDVLSSELEAVVHGWEKMSEEERLCAFRETLRKMAGLGREIVGLKEENDRIKKENIGLKEENDRLK
ncbi:MAG: hypothetical protein LUB83_02455 [Prevotellaceae bacterium]|nr:hypothetical protein [Prevotellaceae bacterium]